MASNTSAVIDVVTESKEIPSLVNKDFLDFDRSSICSGSTTDNSMVQSPSLESFSTIQDVQNLSELSMYENSDMSVRIDSPQKHLETLETFITFRITTKVARIEFPDNEYVVRRRYNDFIWLRQKLVESHPFCIVPPIPAKHSLIGQLDRYSKDFILLRMKALNVFISRVVNHPILNCNEYFKTFLTAKQTEFYTHRRQRNNLGAKIRTLSHSNSTHTALTNRHMEFDRTKAYLTVLHEKLYSIEKIASRINKERAEFVVELSNYHPIFTAWAASEPQLSHLLQSIGCAVERNMSAQNMLVQSYGPTVGHPIRDFLSYVDVVQDTIKKRDGYQCAYESSLDELNRRHSEKDKLIALSREDHSRPQSGGFSLWRQPSNDEKLEKLGLCIPQLLKKVEANQDSLECANESLRSDLAHWQSEKQACLKNVLLSFVNKQIEYYQSTVNAWDHVTSELASSQKSKTSTTVVSNDQQK